MRMLFIVWAEKHYLRTHWQSIRRTRLAPERHGIVTPHPGDVRVVPEVNPIAPIFKSS
jgi:hypothetical protein